MRKLFILFGFALLASSVAQAQETRGMEVSGQYQYIRIYPGQGAPSSSCQGAGGTFAVSMNNWLGLVGDVGGCRVTGLPSGTASHEINYLFGPRLTYRTHGRLTRSVRSSSSICTPTLAAQNRTTCASRVAWSITSASKPFRFMAEAPSHKAGPFVFGRPIAQGMTPRWRQEVCAIE